MMTEKAALRVQDGFLPDANSTLLMSVTVGGDKWAKKALKSPQSARDALVKMGIVTPTGRLTSKYK
eukprot:gene62424-85375_t